MLLWPVIGRAVRPSCGSKLNVIGQHCARLIVHEPGHLILGVSSLPGAESADSCRRPGQKTTAAIVWLRQSVPVDFVK